MRMTLKRGLLCLCLAFPSSSMALGEEASVWPQFLGPTAQGISSAKDLPTRWSESESVRWKTDLPGLGWSSPVTSSNRIYCTAAIPDESDKEILHLSLLICDLKTGKLLKAIPLIDQDLRKSPDIHQKNSHASATPVIDGGRVFVHFGHQGTACTDLDGKLIWKRDDLAYLPVHGNGGSPILSDGLLIFNCDGGESPFVIALDSTTGDTKWKFERPIKAEKSFSFSTPSIIEVNGKKQLITAGSDILQAVEPSSGNEIWRIRYDGFSVIPKPLYVGGLILISTGYMRPELIAVAPDGKGDVTETHIKWRKANVAPNTPSLVSDGKLVYCVTDAGIARGLDLQTGDEIWRKRLGGNYSASPLLAGGKIYFQSEQGECVILEAGDSGNEVSRNELPGRIFASYAVAGQDLIIRSETSLYRIGR